MDQVETVIIGAGVVGLAIARRLAMAGQEVVILEKESAFGTETSARNSEVIHAGIYYPQGSLKARLCVTGKEMLYDFCASHGVAHERCGKLIVATSQAEAATLETIRLKALANGVTDIQRLTKEEAQALEPALACEAALLSPSTGIIDSHGLMLALLGNAEDQGAMVAYGSKTVSGKVVEEGFELEITSDDGDMPLACKNLINAAGLGAQGFAAQLLGLEAKHVMPLHYAKGNYFAHTGANPFSHLIYPVPEPGGLGVHLTLDLGHQMRFGPDVEWLETIDYAVDPARGERFYAAIRKYWPDLKDGSLHADYAGIRPKVTGPGEAAADFCIDGPEIHGLPGLVNLFGIESPGLTSCLAIAEEVAKRLGL